MPENLDKTDIRILENVQENAELTPETLGGRVYATSQRVRNKLTKLRQKGYIKGVHAVLDKSAVGKYVSVIALIKLQEINHDLKQPFHKSLQLIPEITNLITVTGAYDYCVHISTYDMKEYEEVERAICSFGKISALLRLVVLSESKNLDTINLSKNYLRYKKSGS